MIACTLWIFTDYLPEYNMFYFIVFTTLLVGSVFSAYVDSMVYEILYADYSNFDESEYKFFDIYVETLLTLFKGMTKDTKSKFLLYSTF
jgi:hypothetical protein